MTTETVNQEVEVKETQEVDKETKQETVDTGEQDVSKLQAELEALRAEKERMNKALKTANTEAQERRIKLKEYEELGLSDLEKARSLLKEHEEAELKKAEDERNFTEWQEKVKTRYESELTKVKSEIDTYKSQVDTYKEKFESMLVDKEAITLLSSKELKGEPAFIMPYLKKETKVIEVDGQLQAVIVDNHGEPRYNADGQLFTIRDRLLEMREDSVLGKAFDAPKISGVGTNSNPESSKGNSPVKYKNEMSLSEKTEYQTKYGFEAYRKLPAKRPSKK